MMKREKQGRRDDTDEVASSGGKNGLTGCIFPGLVLAAVVGVVIFFWWFFRGPSHGVVWSATSEMRGATTTMPKNGLYEGFHVSFSYPGGYSERKTDRDKVSLEKALLVAGGAASKTIAVTVRDMAGKTLSDIPEYRIRDDIEKYHYRRELVDWSGVPSVMFIRSDEGYERTAFIRSGDLLVTVSVNMRMFADETAIREDFELVLRSLSIKSGVSL